MGLDIIIGKNFLSFGGKMMGKTSEGGPLVSSSNSGGRQLCSRGQVLRPEDKGWGD